MNYLPDLTGDICSFTNSVSDNFGFEIKPTQIRNSLATYDAIIIPGGFATRTLQFDNGFISWIQTGRLAKYKMAICSGSLILGAAGFLKGKRATTNYREYKILKSYCLEVLGDRIVEDQNIITAGAVSASIDLGLFLCNKWAGQNAKNEIKKRMGYKEYKDQA